MTEPLYAGFWRRLAAFIIDRIILYFVYLFLLLAGIAALPHALSQASRLSNGTIADIGLEFLVSYCFAVAFINMLYFTYFHGTVGQTPGKMVLRIKVVKVTGEKMTPGTAFLRWVGYLISGAIVYLGFLWALVDRRKQSWHDKIAGTLVVLVREETAENVQGDRFGPHTTAPEDVRMPGAKAGDLFTNPPTLFP